MSRVSQPGNGGLDSWLWGGTVVEHRVARDMDSASSVEWNSRGGTAGSLLTYALFKSGKELWNYAHRLIMWQERLIRMMIG
jgi:hypothetical protein